MCSFMKIIQIYKDPVPVPNWSNTWTHSEHILNTSELYEHTMNTVFTRWMQLTPGLWGNEEADLHLRAVVPWVPWEVSLSPWRKHEQRNMSLESRLLRSDMIWPCLDLFHLYLDLYSFILIYLDFFCSSDWTFDFWESGLDETRAMTWTVMPSTFVCVMSFWCFHVRSATQMVSKEGEIIDFAGLSTIQSRVS